MSIRSTITQMARDARNAAPEIASASLARRNYAITDIADRLQAHKDEIIQANEADLRLAQEKGVAKPLLDRLHLDGSGIDRMCEAARSVASLPDPIGAVEGLSEQPSGIAVGQMRIPLGVIGMIYESRPNVTLEAASLCIKSGNACILRGGSESINSNIAIAACIEEGLTAAELSAKVIQVVKVTDREGVSALLQQQDYVDLIVPRGGKSLIELVAKTSGIPVLKHLDGICHVYIDETADIAMAIDVAVNSKSSKYAVCNAMETLLVHESVADEVLVEVARQFQELGVEIRGCPKSRSLVDTIIPATEEDWDEEYLAPILAVRIVGNIDEAMAHIAQHGSEHTETIVTESHERAQRFLREVDSATVMINASTQFADGFEFGLGAEIGISTDKLHARGPVGLKGLTTQKFVVYGHGEVRNR